MIKNLKHAKLTANQMVKKRNEHQVQDEGEYKGKRGKQNGFEDKLSKQLILFGAYGLAYADLLPPVRSAGGCKIHEVYSRDQENEDANDRKNVKVFPIEFAVIVVIVLNVGGSEVYIDELLQEQHIIFIDV